jgi:hypothetical protein
MAINETQSAEIADAIISAWFPSGTWCQQDNMISLQKAVHNVATVTNPIAWEKSLDDFIESLLSIKSDLNNVELASSDNNL